MPQTSIKHEKKDKGTLINNIKFVLSEYFGIDGKCC